MEEWREIKGYPGYEISSLGRLRSFKQSKAGKVLKLCLNESGYYYTPPLAPERKTKTIHRLVGETFIPNPDGKPEIDHINRDRTDNRVENLRWATRTEQANNCERTPGRSGHLNIKVRYDVVIRSKEFGNFNRACKSLEEAIRVRDDFLEKHPEIKYSLE